MKILKIFAITIALLGLFYALNWGDHRWEQQIMEMSKKDSLILVHKMTEYKEVFKPWTWFGERGATLLRFTKKGSYMCLDSQYCFIKIITFMQSQNNKPDKFFADNYLIDMFNNQYAELEDSEVAMLGLTYMEGYKFKPVRDDEITKLLKDWMLANK
ncbi:MAG: hypothetical protein Q8M15_14405 [Bacteroidota bacterium]|nr:hypothetical protein [Bacteroidota bacterium]